MTPCCPMCQGDTTLAFRSTDYNLKRSDATFPYYHCRSCDLYFLAPIPTDLGSYYPKEYYPLPKTREELAARASVDQYKVDLIRRFAPSGRLLEVGPSYGGFAYCAREAGYDVTAIEMSGDCCAYLESTVGVRAVQSDRPQEAVAALGQFEVIALWHVVEHLPAAWQTLREVAKHLAPGGILVIAAPNPESLQFQLFRSRWMHLDAPRHVQLIAQRGLAGFLERLGFEAVYATTSDAGAVACNRAGWPCSLRYYSRRRPIRGLLYYAGHAIKGAAGVIERQANLGSAYTMVFRKDAAA